MAKASKMKLISDRHREVIASLASLREKVKSLEEEAMELEIATRVLSRLKDDDDPPSSVDEQSVAPDVVGKPQFSPRPLGIPSTFDMVFQVMEDARNEGIHEMDAPAIVARIESKFWPGVDPNTIRPSLHRFAEKKRIIKRGVYYSLPEPDMEQHSLLPPQKSLNQS